MTAVDNFHNVCVELNDIKSVFANSVRAVNGYESFQSECSH